MRRLLSALAAVLALGGCAALDVSTNSRPGPAFVLEDYFQGRTYAYGLFEDRSTRLVRSFTVVADGTLAGDVLTLDERFLWSDGERQSRVWTFVKTAPGVYEGRAGDVRGTARVTSAGNALRIQYLLNLPMGDGGGVTVRVDDWSHRLDDGIVLNRADVTKFGVHVGRITLVFLKPGQAYPTADSIASMSASDRPK